MTATSLLRPIFSLALLAFAAATLFSAETPPPALSSANAVVPPEAPLKFGSVSIYSENDKYLAGTDQYYTNGFKLSALSAPLNNFTGAAVPAPVRWVATHLGALVPAGSDAKLGLSLGQNIYTPIGIHTPTPDPADRPYAAWLYVGAAFQSYDLSCCDDGGCGVLDTFEINLGVVGSAALGEQIQNGVHDLIGRPHALGWSHQIGNEPGLDLIYTRKWRYETAGATTGLGADFIPHAGVSLGNVFTYVDTGFEARAGWHLPADFGTYLIHPSGDSNSSRPGLSVFLFGAVDGRAVARDLTLDGNSFHGSARVPKKDFVADFQLGLGLGGKHWQFTYSQAVRTKEFNGQSKADNFGAITFTYYY